MNTPSTPLKKRYSSASEYGTPAANESENSLYFSFSLDENPPNKENSIVGGHGQSPSSSLPSTSKAKTPLLRKVLQSNFTPRNANNKRVSFSHLPKQIPAVENAVKIAKTTHVHEHQAAMNSNAMFDLGPIKESVQKIFDEHITDQEANDLIDDDDDEIHNTIIENHSSVKHSSEETLSKSNVAVESTKIKGSKIDSNAQKKVLPAIPARDATKLQNRKSVLPVAKKLMRTTTYKYRSSTYEPRKVTISKSVSAVHPSNAKPIVKTVTSTSQSVPKRSSMAQLPKLTVAATRQSFVKRRETKHGIIKLGHVANPTAIPSTASSSAALVKPEFRKPEQITLRANKPTQCQYCDKFFVKSQAMTTHLHEKCEKIPAVVRRQLLKKADITNDATSKQKQRESLRHESDSISKYSRFFVNLSNGAGLQSDEVEKGLKNLRAELRKTKGGHTGIIRTPKKTLRCHICKQLFLDCVDYAEHISNHET